MFDEKLGAAFDFTEEELAANRDGYMTKEQRIKLRKTILNGHLYPSMFAIGIMIAVNCFLIFGAKPSAGESERFIVMVVMPIGSIVWSIGIYYSWRALSNDLSKGDVATASGRASLASFSPLGGKPSYLRVQNQDFVLDDRKKSEAFRDKARYHIYYAPHTKQILSAEPMQGDE